MVVRNFFQLWNGRKSLRVTFQLHVSLENLRFNMSTRKCDIDTELIIWLMFFVWHSFLCISINFQKFSNKQRVKSSVIRSWTLARHLQLTSINLRLVHLWLICCDLTSSWISLIRHGTHFVVFVWKKERKDKSRLSDLHPECTTRWSSWKSETVGHFFTSIASSRWKFFSWKIIDTSFPPSLPNLSTWSTNSIVFFSIFLLPLCLGDGLLGNNMNAR